MKGTKLVSALFGFDPGLDFLLKFRLRNDHVHGQRLPRERVDLVGQQVAGDGGTIDHLEAPSGCFASIAAKALTTLRVSSQLKGYRYTIRDKIHSKLAMLWQLNKNRNGYWIVTITSKLVQQRILSCQARNCKFRLSIE